MTMMKPFSNNNLLFSNHATDKLYYDKELGNQNTLVVA